MAEYLTDSLVLVRTTRILRNKDARKLFPTDIHHQADRIACSTKIGRVYDRKNI